VLVYLVGQLPREGPTDTDMRAGAVTHGSDRQLW
jgi:hypothetical protein